MGKTEIRIPDKKLRKLKKIAEKRKISFNDLIQEELDHLIESEDDKSTSSRALSIAGKFHSGLGDLAENHDKYLSKK